MTFPDPVQYAIPVFVVLIIAEMLLARYRGGVVYETRDTAAQRRQRTKENTKGANRHKTRARH